ncbi:PD-(D/E)XK nuclease-like domain-containing protein [Streptomyces sp. NPDC056390]|uniref:PD-(D/E)XK nuclease-like domain-containing protein n=1 Tax=Streptomyces sp. NPDC056390 TaxID=3345806 RepID=UPI0035DF94DE
MTAAAEALGEVQPGVYDIDESLYHQDPVPGGSLSSTGARTLVSQCPAKFRHSQDHPEPYRAAFDFGTAAHKLILGEGPELVLVDEPRWNTNAIKARVAKIRAAGNIPLKRPALERVHDMATALSRNAEAADLLAPGSGVAEQSLFWKAGNVWCRARLDWLRPDGFVDYKSCRSAHPDAIQKAVQDHGYHIQDSWYRRGAIALDVIHPQAPSHFIFQEKEPPFVVTVARLDLWRDIAYQACERALFLYETSRANDYWPAYTAETVFIPPPAWLERQFA